MVVKRKYLTGKPEHDAVADRAVRLDAKINIGSARAHERESVILRFDGADTGFYVGRGVQAKTVVNEFARIVKPKTALQGLVLVQPVQGGIEFVGLDFGAAFFHACGVKNLAYLSTDRECAKKENKSGMACIFGRFPTIIHSNRNTMKQCFFVQFAFLLTILFSCNAQSPSSSEQQNTAKPATATPAMTCEQLEGKEYNIAVSTGGKVDGTEILSFKNKAVESSECVKYGFTATPFICTAAADGSLAFEMVMTSEKEGRMDWKGTATQSQVGGTILWVKAGQADIAYTFEGATK